MAYVDSNSKDCAICVCVQEKYDERKGKLFIHTNTHTHSHTGDNGKEAEAARNNFCIAYFLAKLFTYKC